MSLRGSLANREGEGHEPEDPKPEERGYGNEAQGEDERHSIRFVLFLHDNPWVNSRAHERTRVRGYERPNITPPRSEGSRPSAGRSF